MKNTTKRFFAFFMAMCMIFATLTTASAAEPVPGQDIPSVNATGDDGIMPLSMYNGLWLDKGKIPISHFNVKAPRRYGKIYVTFKVESSNSGDGGDVYLRGKGTLYASKKVFAKDGEVKAEFNSPGFWPIPGPEEYTVEFYPYQNKAGMRLNVWLY